MKRILFLLVFLLAFVNASAQMPDHLECDFVQTQHMKMLKEPAVSYGRLSFSSPDKLRWEYVSPFSFAFILDGQNISILKDGKELRNGKEQDKMFRAMAGMMLDCASGKAFDDSDAFDTEEKTEGDIKVVTMVPRQKQLQRFISKFVVNYDVLQNVAVRVEVYLPSGDYTTIEFKNVRK